MNDTTPRYIKVGDALSQLLNVRCPSDHRALRSVSRRLAKQEGSFGSLFSSL